MRKVPDQHEAAEPAQVLPPGLRRAGSGAVPGGPGASAERPGHGRRRARGLRRGGRLRGPGPRRRRGRQRRRLRGLGALPGVGGHRLQEGGRPVAPKEGPVLAVGARHRPRLQVPQDQSQQVVSHPRERGRGAGRRAHHHGALHRHRVAKGLDEPPAPLPAAVTLLHLSGPRRAGPGGEAGTVWV